MMPYYFYVLAKLYLVTAWIMTHSKATSPADNKGKGQTSTMPHLNDAPDLTYVLIEN